MDDVNVIRIRRLLKTETDAELTRDLQTLTAQRDAAKKQVERYAEEIEHIKAELVRRERETADYSLKVGCHLWVTDSWLKGERDEEIKYALQHAQAYTITAITDDLIHVEILINKNEDVWNVRIPHDLAVSMRHAYFNNEMSKP